MVGVKTPTMSKGAKPRQRSTHMKTKLAQEAAGRLLLEHPEGLTRVQAVKKLGLSPRRWQSIIKHPMFMQHPENSSRKGRGTRWIVDRKMLEEAYGENKYPEPPIKEATSTPEKRESVDETLKRFYEANKPKDADTNIVDFFTGSPPYSPSFKASRRVTITVDGVSIDMDISGSVSFTING